MLVEIIKDENNQPIGWSLQGENREELDKLIDIRNLQFFGFDERVIRYAGRKGGNDENYDPGILSWKQKRFINSGE
jgi:hypothetical protein